jgi:hypothetical protein
MVLGVGVDPFWCGMLGVTWKTRNVRSISQDSCYWWYFSFQKVFLGPLLQILKHSIFTDVFDLKLTQRFKGHS